MGTTTHNYINIEFSSKETFDRFKERFMAAPSDIHYWSDFLSGDYSFFDGNDLEEQKQLILDFNKVIPIFEKDEDKIDDRLVDDPEILKPIINFMAKHDISPNTNESKKVLKFISVLLTNSNEHTQISKISDLVKNIANQANVLPFIMNMTMDDFINKYYNKGVLYNEQYEKYYKRIKGIYKRMDETWGNGYGWDVGVDLDLQYNKFSMNFVTKHTSPYKLFEELRKQTLELDPKCSFKIETDNPETQVIEVWDNDGAFEYTMDSDPQTYLHELETRGFGSAEDFGYAYNDELGMYTQEAFYG